MCAGVQQALFVVLPDQLVLGRSDCSSQRYGHQPLSVARGCGALRSVNFASLHQHTCCVPLGGVVTVVHCVSTVMCSRAGAGVGLRARVDGARRIPAPLFGALYSMGSRNPVSGTYAVVSPSTACTCSLDPGHLSTEYHVGVQPPAGAALGSFVTCSRNKCMRAAPETYLYYISSVFTRCRPLASLRALHPRDAVALAVAN